MAQNICNICGANYEYKNGRWVCPACGAYKPEELSNEEVTLLYNASQKIRLALFDDAEEQYKDIVSKYPDNPDGYWGLVLAKYGIKYEQDYDGKMIPSCYAASYESVLTDKNYLKAIELADKDNRKYFEEQANRIEKIRKEWIEKAAKEEPYDIFISYKDTEKENGTERTKDSYDALELYTMLTKLGYRVFYSRESLKDKTGEKYEPYIFNALNTAHIMIVYGSKPEYIESTWIKNEWMRFYKRIKLGKKQPNALLVVYNGFNPSELPSPLSKMQNLDRSRIDFSREIESYCKRVIKAATTVLPKIERVEIKTKKGKVGQIVKIQAIELKNNSAPKAEIVREEVKKREIGNYTVSKLTANAENELKVAYAQLAGAIFNEAKNAFNNFLVKNPKNGLALTGKLLAENKNKDLDEFSSVGIKTFADWKLLEQVLLFSEKTVSEKILKALCGETGNAFNSGNLQRARDIYAQISSYEDNNVTEMRKTVCDLSKSIIGKDDESAKYFIDGYLIYEQNEIPFLEQIKQTVNISIEKGDFGFAKEYVSEWLKYESDDFSANIATLKIKYQVKNLAEVFSKIESKNNYGEIDDVLHKLNEESAQQCFNAVCERVNAFLTADNFGKEAFSYIDKFFRYSFAERNNYINKFLSLTANKATENSAKIFDLLLSLSDYETEDYNLYTLKFADNALKNGNFDLANKYYDKINELHETALSWEGKLKCHLRARNETEYSANIKNLTEFSFIDNILSLLENDDKRTAFIIRLIGYVYATIKTAKSDTEKCVKVFENLLAYMPKDYDGKLIEWLFKFSRFLKSNGYFVLAEKLYATIVNYDAENHVAYWEMLQAKLNCKDENAIIHQQSLISEFQEFQNALLASANNDSALKHYIEIQNKQKTWVEKEKQRQISAKKRKKFIKIVSIVLAAVIIITAGIFGGVSYYNSESVLKYETTDSGFSVYSGKYYKADETLVIPYKVDNKSVTEIKAEAFKNHTEIKKVIIPTAVTKIGDGAFEGCVNLESVEIKDVDNNANSENATANASLKTQNQNGISIFAAKIASAETFGANNNNSDIKLSIIGSRAFKGCSKLNDFTLNYGLKTIGEEAFSGTGLKEITIPETVEFVGKAAFENCNALKSIGLVERGSIPQNWDADWNKGNEIKIEFSLRVIFDYNGADRAIKTEQYVVYEQAYTFPVPTKEGYTFDGWYRGETKLTGKDGSSLSDWNYTGGGTVKAEFTANENTLFFNGNGATSGDMQSQKIHTAENINLNTNGFTRAGYTFTGWATSANGTKVYNDGALYTMGKNSSYVLYAVWQANTNTLHFDANGGNGVMADKNINTDSTTTLSANTFTRNGYTFAGWATSANGTKAYNDKANYKMGANNEYTLYAVWSLDTYTISYYLNGGSVSGNTKSYTVLSDTFTLNNPTKDDDVFWGWSGTDIIGTSMTVTIEKGSTGNRTYTANWQGTLNYNLLSDNTYEITSANKDLLSNTIVIPESYKGKTVTKIANSAFKDCDTITRVVIPDTIKTIDDYGFANCSNLVDLEIANGVTSIGYHAFENCTSLINAVIPDSAEFIGSAVFSGCSKMESLTVPFLSKEVGTTKSSTWQYPLGDIFWTAEYAGGVATTQYFYGGNTSSPRSMQFYIPATLKHVTVTKGNIFYGAFYNCSGLESVTITGDITSIEGYAFYNCTNLKSVSLPESINNIESFAFKDCKSLTSFNIPYGVTTLKQDILSGCENLKSIVIPDSVTSLQRGVFFNDFALEKVTMSKNITSIGTYVFSHCASLEEIVIPSKLTSIGSTSFYDCGNLKTVYYEGTGMDWWKNISISSENDSLTSATRYYYSEIEPSASGNYWHYVAGEPSSWDITFYTISLDLANGVISGNIPSGAALYNGHFYYFYKTAKSWEDAKYYCESLGGHLATITDSAEDSFIISKYGGNRCFVGGYKEGNNWKWVTGESWNYTNWYKGQPDNGGKVEDKLGYYLNNQWNDYTSSATDIVGFICEWEGTSVINYTATTSTFTLTNPTKTGYTFTGWSGTGINGLSKNVTITKGSTGDRVYVANWEKNNTSNSVYTRVNSIGVEDDNGDYILFGEYPQTIKANNVNITTTTDSRGYYLGSDCAYYAKVTANPYESGYKFSNGNTVATGTVYYFKVEPIKWRILEESNGTATLLCELIIDGQKYDTSSNNYANSDIRAWLNDNFYNTAFNDLQKQLINTVEVDNSARSTNPNNSSTYWNSGKNNYASSNTSDKVWLLSVQETTNTGYGFNSSVGSYDAKRQKLTTDYVRANYVFVDYTTGYVNNSWWWTRSPYYGNATTVNDCGTYGNVVQNRLSVDTKVGVVPAIKITLTGAGYFEPETTTLYKRVNANGIEDDSGDYVLFGEYPQSEVTDSGLKTTLNTLAGTLPTNGNSNGWTSYEYYISGSNSTDFMWYQDISYNGEKYRGVYFTKYRSRTTVGSNSDTYQNDNGYAPNSIYWFKWEPVKWQIITTQDDGQALLLSELVIDSQNFYLNYNTRTINGNTVYANNYEYSDIRNWLNEVFYSSAFNNAQQGIIQTTLIDNSAKTTNPNNNSKYWDNGTNNYSCGNTYDNVFLLSVSDLTNETYGYSNNVEIKDDFRIKQASDYAKSQGCGEWENGASNWWTRSSVYNSSHYIRVCAADGTVGEYMYNGVYDTQNGIVPALWIKL